MQDSQSKRSGFHHAAAPEARVRGAASDALDESLRAAFEHSLHFMVVLDPEGTVLHANRAARDACGPEASDPVGGRFADGGWWRGLAEERRRVEAAVGQARAGAVAREELSLCTGSLLELSIRPVFDESGRAEVLIAEGQDVTEARWAERALRVSEAKFSGIIGISSDAVISIDSNSEITLFNQGAEAIFGYRAADVLGKPLELLIPERFRRAHGSHLRVFASSPVAARRMGERQEIMGLRADGTEFPAEASISKLDLFGEYVFTVVLRDITDRKRTERSQRFLARAGTILSSTLEYEETVASVAGLMVPELADWSVVYVRDEPTGSVRRLDVAHAEPDRKPLLTELLRYPLDPRLPHPVFTVLDTGRPEVMADVPGEFVEALSLDDAHRALYDRLGFGSLMIVPLIARGATLGAMGFFSAAQQRYGPDDLALAQDLALMAAMAVDNARLYSEAQAAVQSRDDLISVVSHDLGNPLSAIRIGTSLLLRTSPEAGDQTGRQHLEFIRQSAQQMENLINDLMDVKRLEAGRVVLQLRDVRLDRLVGEVLEVFRPIADSRSLVLEWLPADELPVVTGDHKRLAQVLSNLVGNAVKFTESGGRIEIRAQPAGGQVLLSVSDSGIGIAPEHLPHVFDRFWQVRREGKKGLGLGLAIARGIVDAHGGRIWAESTPGAGTTFLFTLPAGEA